MSLALAVALLVPAQDLPVTPERTPAADRLEDLAFLRRKLEEVHPDLYEVHSRREWEQAAAGIAERIETLDDLGFYAVLSELVALAADGHTGLMPAPDQMSVLGASSLPVRFEAFADGIYVTAAEAGYASIVGRRVESIGGEPVERVLEQVAPFVSADNPIAQRLWAVPLLRRKAIHDFLRIPDQEGATRLTVVPGGDRRHEVSLEPGSVARLPRESLPEGWVDARAESAPALWLDRRSEPYWYEYLPDSRTVFFQFNAVRDASDESLAEFCERMFAFIDGADVERLVIDMRWNGGGNNYKNQPLLHGLIRCKKLFHDGGMFVITSPRTFSAAMACAGAIERDTPALFVGEATGAGPNHAGDSDAFPLPRSGHTLRVSKLAWQWSDPRDVRRAIEPDLAAEVTYADWKSGWDPGLEAVLGYVAKEGELPPPNMRWWGKVGR